MPKLSCQFAACDYLIGRVIWCRLTRPGCEPLSDPVPNTDPLLLRRVMPLRVCVNIGCVRTKGSTTLVGFRFSLRSAALHVEVF